MANLLLRSLYARLVMALLYSLLYVYVYVVFLNGNFAYFGYLYSTPSLSLFLFSLVWACVPICFYKGTGSLVSFITILLYVLAYIPIVLTLGLWGEDAEVCMEHQLVLAVAMIVFFLCERMSFSFTLNPNFQLVSFEFFEIFVWSLLLCMMFLYRNELQFVNFLSDSDLMYTLRAENSKMLVGVNEYLLHWLETAFLPLLLVSYLAQRNKIKVAMVIIAYMLLYMIRLQKITFFLPYLLLIIYWCMSRFKGMVAYFYHIVIFVIWVLSVLLLSICDGEKGFVLASIFFLRTMSVAGFSYCAYLDFFNTHDYTYYSHLSPVNYFTHSYPYEVPLGKVMFDEMNGNAMFWPTDGIAACGLYGIAIISFIFAGVLISLNGLSNLAAPKYLFVLFFPIVADLLNISLFTVFLTSGLVFVFLFLFIIRFPFLSQQNVVD